MTVVVINEVRFHCPTDLDIVSCIECKRCIRPQAVHHHLRSIHNVNVVDCDVERSIGYKYNNSLNFFSFPDFLDDVPSIRSEKGFECAACKKVCQTRHLMMEHLHRVHQFSHAGRYFENVTRRISYKTLLNDRVKVMSCLAHLFTGSAFESFL